MAKMTIESKEISIDANSNEMIDMSHSLLLAVGKLLDMPLHHVIYLVRKADDLQKKNINIDTTTNTYVVKDISEYKGE